VEALEGVREGGPDVVALNLHGPRLRFPCGYYLHSDSGQVPGLSRTMALLHTKGTHADTVFTLLGTLSASVSLTFWLRL
jgi:hypothetical protein